MSKAKNQYCHICGRPATDMHHLIGGTSNRKNSEKYKLVVPLCRDCHRLVTDDPNWARASKVYGQREFERKHGSREDFIRIFGKSWILEDE